MMENGKILNLKEKEKYFLRMESIILDNLKII